MVGRGLTVTVRLGRAATVVALVTGLTGATVVEAEGQSLYVGEPEEAYLRILQLAGAWGGLGREGLFR